MKSKIFSLFAFLTLVTLFVTSCSDDSSVVETSAKSNSLFAKEDGDPWPKSGNVKTVWTLGRKSRLCHGIGLCKHESTTVTIGQLPPFTFSKMKENNQIFTDIYVVNDNELLMDLDPTSAEYAEYFFGGKKVVLEEDVVLDNSTIGVKIATDFTIAAGSYAFETNPYTGWQTIHVYNSKK